MAAGNWGSGGGGTEGETRATRWTLRPPRCGDVQPSLAGAAVSGASGGIGSRHSDTRHQTPHNPGPDTYARGDDPDDPHIWGTWEPESLDTLLSIRSGYQGLGRAMYCLAKWTQRTWGIPTDRWVWVVTLRPQQREAPPNRRGPTPPRPTTLQLCPYMVAARLMTLLWPGPHTPTQNYPHLTEEDMPGIQRCFFRTLNYLQQTRPHVLEQI